MKFTKRILTLLTAVVLCLAPMVLMAGAAELSESDIMSDNECTHSNGWHIILSTAANRYFYGSPTSTHCPPYYYTGVYHECLDCGHVKYDTYYSQTRSVHLFSNGVCSYCGYEK